MSQAPQADELPDLQRVHLELNHLRAKPFRDVIADPVMLGCLRNVVAAQKAARAQRRAKSVPEAATFELTP